MSEIKPVYQVRQLGEWIEVDKSIFDELYIQNKFPHRILYPAAAYEALKAENEKLKECLFQAQTSAIDIAHQNEALQKEVTHWKANHADLKERLHVATHRTDLPSDRLPLFDKMKAEIAALQKENAEWKTVLDCNEQIRVAQAKRIAELEAATEHLGLTPKQAADGLARYKAQVAEIESLRKQVKLHEETQSNELIKLRETVQFLEDKQREVTDILLLRIDPFEIIKRAGSSLSASKNGE